MTASDRLTPEFAKGSESAPRQRLPYGAVPLDPWRAGGEHVRNLYSLASISRIERGLRRTMIDQDWFRQDERAHDIRTLMRNSLISSHFTRIDRNNGFHTGTFMDLADPRVEWARQGLATPEELFTLLVDYPDIGSLELAKLSHPFDFAATNDMDRAMDELMLGVDGELLDDEPRYKLKRTELGIPAGIVLRKQDLMDYPTQHGTIRVVQRRGFLVFDGKGMDDPHFKRLLKNPKNEQALWAKIEWYLYEHPTGEPFGWVQPQATSYYAKYIQ